MMIVCVLIVPCAFSSTHCSSRYWMNAGSEIWLNYRLASYLGSAIHGQKAVGILSAHTATTTTGTALTRLSLRHALRTSLAVVNGSLALLDLTPLLLRVSSGGLLLLLLLLLVLLHSLHCFSLLLDLVRLLLLLLCLGLRS